MFLRLFIIPVYGILPVPQRFIEIDQAEDIEEMIHLQLHVMELPQFLHAAADVVLIHRVAVPCILDELRDLVAVVGIDIDDIIGKAPVTDHIIDRGFLPAVDQLLRALARDTHDVLFIFYREEEGPIRHSFFQNGDSRNLISSHTENGSVTYEQLSEPNGYGVYELKVS